MRERELTIDFLLILGDIEEERVMVDFDDLRDFFDFFNPQCFLFLG